MAAVKGLRTIAENLTRTRKLGKPVTDVASLDPSAGRGTLNAVTDLAEYNRVQGELDQINSAPVTPAAVRQEIALRQEQQIENARKDGIVNPQAPLRLDFQTRDSAEFSERLNNQLFDPEYSARSILGLSETDEIEELRSLVDAGAAAGADLRFVEAVDDIRASQARHNRVKESVFSKLEQDPRWVARTDEWFGDSPYKGDLLFHTDRVTDPTRADSFIQFEDARELGLHAGTNSAAERVIGAGGVEDAMFGLQRMEDDLSQVAGTLNMSRTQLDTRIARALETKLASKFRQGEGMFDADIWNEAKGILTDFFAEINARNPEMNAGGLLQRLQDLPTPSTTPMLFRGRNGLLLEDLGGFSPGQVSRQLEEIFPDDVDEITAAMSTGTRGEKSKRLQTFIESKGYDHVVYHNSVEDRGSLSIINWNPDLQRTPWHPDFTRDNPNEAAKQASAVILGMLGVGNAAVRQEQQTET